MCIARTENILQSPDRQNLKLQAVILFIIKITSEVFKEFIW